MFDAHSVSRTNGDYRTTYVGGLLEVDSDALGVAGSRTFYAFASFPIAVVAHSTGNVAFVFGNHLGSTVAAFDDASNSLSLLRFTPFGSERSPSGDLPSDARFTGQVADNTNADSGGTGLIFYNARYYDPAVGAMTSADILIPGIENPVALNRYAYVFNVPTMLTDPGGHDPEESYLMPGGRGIAQIRYFEQQSARYHELSIKIDQIAAEIRRVEAGGQPAGKELYFALNEAIAGRNAAIDGIRKVAGDDWGTDNLPARTPHAARVEDGWAEGFVEFVSTASGVMATGFWAAGILCGGCTAPAASALSAVSFWTGATDTLFDCVSRESSCISGGVGLGLSRASQGLLNNTSIDQAASVFATFSEAYTTGLGAAGGSVSASDLDRLDRWNPSEEEMGLLRGLVYGGG